MKITGIIAEYNPFHEGHAYQIRQARSLGADHVIVIMSPDFVQRGEPALIDKYTRTRMALAGGADLVLELPVCFASGSAEYFAKGAVGILDSLGCVSCLSFGCEMPDRVLFNELADLLTDEPAPYKSQLDRFLRQGATFPEAREKAVLACLDEAEILRFTESTGYSHLKTADAATLHALLSSPNNILALEYIKALKFFDSPILPEPLLRQGEAYHSQKLPEDRMTFPSAGAIRNHLINSVSPDPLSSLSEELIPAASLAVLKTALSMRPDTAQVYRRYASLLQYCLWSKKDRLSLFLDSSEDMANRIQRSAFSRQMDLSQLSGAIKSRQMTESRIRRILLHAFLDICQEDTDHHLKTPENWYVRILGFKKTSASLLHEIKAHASIPMISKNADASDILTPSGYAMFRQDLHASDTYAFLDGRDDFFGADVRRSPVILS